MTRRRSAEPERQRRLRLCAPAIVVAASIATGCSQFAVDGLQLRSDDSIEIIEPGDRAEVSAPITVRWTDRSPREGARYVVLVDRSPMPPGESVAWFGRVDDSCVEAQGCPDELWLTRRGIIVTDETEASITIVPHRRSSDRGPHELTVIRIDADGHRDGEAAFTVVVDLQSGR